MDHKTFINNLPAAKRTGLGELSDSPGLRQLLVYSFLIVIFAVVVTSEVPGWPLAVLPLGILLTFLFNLEHECTHKTPFRTEWINEWAGAICGFLIFQPFIWFRYFHLAHHRFTNDPERDPELVGKQKPTTWAGYVVFVLALVYWMNKAGLLFSNAFGEIRGDFIPQSAHARIRSEARASLAIYAALFVASVAITPVLLWIWIIPLAIGFPFLRLYHLAEHGHCPYVSNMFENTRTVFTNRIVRFVTWNMPYHIEHHTLPMVPFYRLPDLHLLMRAHLKTTSDNYSQFTIEYAGTLKLAKNGDEKA
jgi:fatty acid desaturase